MVEKILVTDFLLLAAKHPVLDVRSPGEYNHAHIPGAHSLPLFDDEERKVVGTAYKQQSRETAIKIGLDYFGVKMRKMVEMVEQMFAASHQPPAFQTPNITEQKKEKNVVLVHCWRGGMRSAGVAWLLDLYGFKVYTLTGGYKSYRNFARQQFEKKYNFKVIAGYTGSGKTEILNALQKNGASVIDLEGLAQHKGSAFGNLNLQPQPSQEMFENLLATALLKHDSTSATSENKCIWIEDESQRIGNINIPPPFFQQKQQSPVYFLDIPFEERLDYITADYGKFEKEKLINAIVRIKKRLGGLETKTAVNYLIEDDIKNCFAVLLKYYDKWYLKGVSNKGKDVITTKIHSDKVEAIYNAALILKKELNTVTEK